ncbi:MAG: hypothetical protein ACETWE_13665 [Candidatus Bathyarchaeia archaeon]
MATEKAHIIGICKIQCLAARHEEAELTPLYREAWTIPIAEYVTAAK